MPMRLESQQSDFAAQFERLLHLRSDEEHTVGDTVRGILADVKARGDAALIDYTKQFDRLDITAATMRISEARIQQAQKDCDAGVREALQLAADRLRQYHEKQTPQDVLYTDADGTRLGWRWTPVDAVGLYVPGGRASYPSSVLHNAIPALVAGCQRLAMVVPTPDGVVNPAILTAAAIAGIEEIYSVGGAQAIAALAYGTATIAPVDMIVGPGNAYVAEAKRQLFGRIGIDMVAGPSEILVVADNKNNPAWIAADLLSQAEHDPDAQSILITDDAAFADEVERSILRTLATLERKEIAGKSWANYGAVIVVTSLKDAPALINRMAPEHLELAVEDPDALAADVRHAGAIFLGRYTPEAIGDYMAGPSHVLPTSRTARFSSGLSVHSFMKKSSIIGCTGQSVQTISEKAEKIAISEGLGAHALSLRCRFGQ